jgi:hypothetical protein
LPILGEEVVTRGDGDYDEIEDTLVAHIVLVTDNDKAVPYYPEYDRDNHRLDWSSAEQKPNMGESYRVIYFMYTSSPITSIVELGDDE